METAVALLRHAIGLVTRQPLQTVRVVAPALVLMGGVGLIAAIAAPEVLQIDHANPDLRGLGSGSLSFALLAAFVVSYALMAILWHRHTLRETRAPLPMSAPLVFGYLWRVIAIALIQLFVSLVLVVPLVLTMQGGASAPTPTLLSILLSTFITQMVLLWLSLRLSLILPAAALGRPIPMAQSWRYTVPLARPLWGVAAVLALVNSVLTGVVAFFDLSNPGHLLAIELPIYILEGLLIFSVLTTLYARLIQKNQPNAG